MQEEESEFSLPARYKFHYQFFLKTSGEESDESLAFMKQDWSHLFVTKPRTHHLTLGECIAKADNRLIPKFFTEYLIQDVRVSLYGVSYGWSNVAKVGVGYVLQYVLVRKTAVDKVAPMSKEEKELAKRIRKMRRLARLECKEEAQQFDFEDLTLDYITNANKRGK